MCVLCCLVLPRLPVNLITNHSFFFFSSTAKTWKPISLLQYVQRLCARTDWESQQAKAQQRNVLAACRARVFVLFPALTNSASFSTKGLKTLEHNEMTHLLSWFSKPRMFTCYIKYKIKWSRNYIIIFSCIIPIIMLHLQGFNTF